MWLLPFTHHMLLSSKRMKWTFVLTSLHWNHREEGEKCTEPVLDLATPPGNTGLVSWGADASQPKWVSSSKALLAHIGRGLLFAGQLPPLEQAHPAAPVGCLLPSSLLFLGSSILNIPKSGLFLSYSGSLLLYLVFDYLITHSFLHAGSAGQNLISFALAHCSNEIFIGRLG